MQRSVVRVLEAQMALLESTFITLPACCAFFFFHFVSISISDALSDKRASAQLLNLSLFIFCYL